MASTDFFCPPGTIYRTKDSSKEAFYQLKPAIEGGSGVVLINAVSIVQKDIVAPISCLQNIKVYYHFGQDFGQAQVAGEVLLGSAGDMDQSANMIDEYFNKYRVSVYNQPIQISGQGHQQYFFFLERMQKQPVIPGIHVAPFVFFGHILDSSPSAG